jgi:YVTN family beta-propeller protein
MGSASAARTAHRRLARLPAALAGLALTVGAGCGGEARETAARPPVPDDAPLEFRSPQSIGDPAKLAIPLDGQPAGIATGEEGVWVAVYDGRAGDRVVRIDPATNQVAASVPVRGDPYEVAVGEGSVWVTCNSAESGDVLHRIDPGTNRVVATWAFPRNSTTAIAAGEGAAWVARSGSLVRIDAETNEVVRTIPLAGGAARLNLDELAVGHGAVWIVALGGLDGPGDLIRVDPETNRVASTARAGVLNMGTGPGGVWISGCVDCDQHRDTFYAQRAETGTGTPTGPRIAVERVGFSPLYVGEGAAWFGGYSGDGDTVAFVMDLESHSIEELLRIGTFAFAGMAYDPRSQSIWVARAAPASVVRLAVDR